MDLDALERLARAATPGPWDAGKYGIAGGEDFTTPVVSWVYAWSECADEAADKPYIAAASPDVVLTLIARVRAAEAERDRLRAERWEAYPRALQAAADVVVRADVTVAYIDPDESEVLEWIDNLANDILELSAAQIDAFAAERAAIEATALAVDALRDASATAGEPRLVSWFERPYATDGSAVPATPYGRKFAAGQRLEFSAERILATGCAACG